MARKKKSRKNVRPPPQYSPYYTSGPQLDAQRLEIQSNDEIFAIFIKVLVFVVVCVFVYLIVRSFSWKKATKMADGSSVTDTGNNANVGITENIVKTVSGFGTFGIIAVVLQATSVLLMFIGRLLFNFNIAWFEFSAFAAFILSFGFVGLDISTNGTDNLVYFAPMTIVALVIIMFLARLSPGLSFADRNFLNRLFEGADLDSSVDREGAKKDIESQVDLYITNKFQRRNAAQNASSRSWFYRHVYNRYDSYLDNFLQKLSDKMKKANFDDGEIGKFQATFDAPPPKP